MARHTVRFSIPERQLQRADIEFTVWRDEDRVGTLCVSNGSAEWRPANFETRYRIRWDQLDEFARKRGRPIR